jgi:hypothetical protein
MGPRHYDGKRLRQAYAKWLEAMLQSTDEDANVWNHAPELRAAVWDALPESHPVSSEFELDRFDPKAFYATGECVDRDGHVDPKAAANYFLECVERCREISRFAIEIAVCDIALPEPLILTSNEATTRFT